MMAFRPRMQTRLEGVTVVDDLRYRDWHGVVADVWNVSLARGARGEYLSPDPRMFIVLDKSGTGDIRLGTTPETTGELGGACGHAISYIPADLRIWSRVEDDCRLRHLDLHFDMAAIGERFEEGLDRAVVETPRIAFSDERVLSIARLIAAECLQPGELHGLYGDSLTTALFVAAFQIGRRKERKHAQLPPWQLRRATDYIVSHCLRTIRLQELADLTGLSQSHFCRAFKASTGVPPHQWQMQARLSKVKDLLARRDLSLTDVAVASGFSDQAHFTRVFRRMVGTTPAMWRRNRGAGNRAADRPGEYAQ